MQRTVNELAALVQGRVHGPGDRIVTAARPIDAAGPGEVTFAENGRYLRHLPACRATAVVVPAALATEHSELLGNLPPTLSLIIVPEALPAFITLAEHLRGGTADVSIGIDPRAVIHPTVTLGADVSVHPLAVIGEGTAIGARCRIHAGAVVGRRCRLGDDVTLFPHVVLYDEVVLGQRVIVHANAVLGGDGFGYRVQEGRHVKMPQMGSVEIGDDVEIGAGTTIDRGTFQPTRVGAGTKIDNLVQIGHNCQIGRHNLLCAQVGIAGSCSTGDYVVLAGQAGMADHVHMGDGAVAGAKAGVHRDVPAGEHVAGFPARPAQEFRRIHAALSALPELRRELRAFQRQFGINLPEKAAG